jgi:hypothetical protein
VVQEPRKDGLDKKQVVQYEATGGTHTFHERMITTSEWKRAGVEDQKTVTWNRDNKFQVPVSDLNEAALKLLEDDTELNVREV